MKILNTLLFATAITLSSITLGVAGHNTELSLANATMTFDRFVMDEGCHARKMKSMSIISEEDFNELKSAIISVESFNQTKNQVLEEEIILPYERDPCVLFWTCLKTQANCFSTLTTLQISHSNLTDIPNWVLINKRS